MSLLDLIKKGGLLEAATATVATPATVGGQEPRSVAKVARVAVAGEPEPKAEERLFFSQTSPRRTAKTAKTPSREPENTTLNEVPKVAKLTEKGACARTCVDCNGKSVPQWRRGGKVIEIIEATGRPALMCHYCGRRVEAAGHKGGSK